MFACFWNDLGILHSYNQRPGIDASNEVLVTHFQVFLRASNCFCEQYKCYGTEITQYFPHQ